MIFYICTNIVSIHSSVEFQDLRRKLRYLNLRWNFFFPFFFPIFFGFSTEKKIFNGQFDPIFLPVVKKVRWKKGAKYEFLIRHRFKDMTVWIFSKSQLVFFCSSQWDMKKLILYMKKEPVLEWGGWIFSLFFFKKESIFFLK